jgi:pimeloyl-ACP methyl ester carboxylesterase
MAAFAGQFGPHAPEATYVEHEYEELTFDTGEVEMNYATVGGSSLPALLLIPGQTESWWGYEKALGLLGEHFQAYAVDLRGQGRSTRTPGRYSLDLIGNDLVRFIDGVIGRPTIVAGLSSGGVLSAWLSAYAKPGQVIGAYYEDPPLFSSHLQPAVGQGLRQAIGPVFALMGKYLGPQWSIGDWDGMVAALPNELPEHMGMVAGLFGMGGEGPPQELKEYDPEWGIAFWSGAFYGTCDHEQLLRSVKVPVLFTHHFRMIDAASGALMGASSDLQADRVRQLVIGAGQPFTYVDLPATPHSLHGADEKIYLDTLLNWVEGLSTVEGRGE